jgi:hypothetical protein
VAGIVNATLALQETQSNDRKFCRII